MHLAVDAGDSSVGIQRDRGVVIKPRRTPLKQRRHNRHMGLASYIRQLFRRRAGYHLRQIEQLQILALAEVLRAEQFRQADDLRAEPSRFADVFDRGRKVCLRVSAHAHLHKGDGKFRRCGHALSLDPLL